ncbi:hypothetical protein BV898_18548 [Hypsibius exemplaris]|uniref:Histone H2A/H2B/H3 domain-containing protein n=1 Tax=Hypsibius exemplaris TaxID=2072580 RepID=A0A9X6NHT0_HYPEX|nr:hypothetical protein BV898_18548 [Hypsibius exemplaris]
MPPKVSGKSVAKEVRKGAKGHPRSQCQAPQKAKGVAMAIMNSFVNDIFERIAAESSAPLAITTKVHHHFSRNSNPVRPCCPESSPTRVSEGTKAVTKYTSAK